jgi:DNA-binding transcriptional MerR regulator
MVQGDSFSDDELARLEREHPQGLSSDEIVACFTRKGIKFTEATLRKYVQLGLLPRSVRVGLKGRHRGSQGMYPVTIIRRIQRLKAMMSEFTIEQIQKEFLFVRGDVEELERTLGRIFSAFAMATKSGRDGEVATRAMQKELAEARSLASELVAKITGVETRLTMQARLQREAM